MWAGIRFAVAFIPVAALLGGCLPVGMPQSATAQTADPVVELFPVCGGVFGLCGYKDQATGETVIPLQFQRAFRFSEGLAAVGIDGEHGYIDRSGHLVIEPAYQLAGTFNHGLAEVIVDDKAGVINKLGVFQIQPEFARAIPLTDTTVIAAEGSWYNGGLEGFHDQAFFISGLNKGAGLYHLTDGWLTDRTIRFSPVDRTQSGLIWAADSDRPLFDRNLIYGLMRADGTWQIDPAFSRVGPLHAGSAVVGVKGLDGEERQGVVSEHGETQIPFEYDKITNWSSRYRIVHRNGKMGLLDKEGNLATGQFWDEIQGPEGTQLGRVRSGATWTNVTDEGNLVTEYQQGEIIVECVDGLTIKRSDDGVRVFKPDGSPVSDIVYDHEYFNARHCANPISVGFNDKWGFITQDGLAIPDIPMFDNIHGFEDGGAWARKAGLWGKIDTTGAVVIPFQFETLGSRGFGYAGVTRGGVEFLVDPWDKVTPLVQNYPTTPADWLKCQGDSRLFTNDGKWGLVGPDGETIIPADHVALSCFSNGVSWFPVSSESAWCPIGPEGARIEAIACQQAYYSQIWSHYYPEPLDDDPYLSSVKWAVAHLEWAAGIREDPPCFIGDGTRGHGTRSLIGGDSCGA